MQRVCCSSAVGTVASIQKVFGVNPNWLQNSRAHFPESLFCFFFFGSSTVGEVESALNMSPEDFHQKYGAQKPSKEDSNIVFHCRAGVRSLEAMETAHQLGYKK